MSCTLCELSDTCTKPLQMGNGKKSAKIMIVQENPYGSENMRGQYMGGKAGNLMRAALGEVGIDIDDVYYTAVVKCSTPEDRMPTPDEGRACIDYLMAEIDVIKPEIIVPTGNLSLKMLTKLTSITKQRGRLIELDGQKYFPIIHPNMVLKQPKYMDWFSKDMLNLASVLSGETPKDVIAFDTDRRYCETYESAIDEIQRFMNLPPGSRVVVDLETVKTDPFVPRVEISERMKAQHPTSSIPKILAIGLSDRAGYGCAIPLYHRQTPFIGYEIGTIVKFLRFLFERSDIEFVAHNAKFDIKWLRAQLDIWVSNFRWDTMMMHYVGVTEEKGTHGLKELAWIETDMGGYDDKLDEVKPKGVDEGNYDLIDWDILKVYLADDCDCTYRLLDKYLPIIQENEELNWIWNNLVVPGSEVLLDIECNGAYIDLSWLGFLEKAYPTEIIRLEEKLHTYPEVLEMEREWTQLWEERMSIGGIKKANRTEEQQAKFTLYKKYDPSKGGTEFNFGSTTQLGVLMFDKLGLKTVVLTEKGNPSTNDDSLKYMLKQHPICDALLEYRKVKHLYNNFVSTMRYYVDKDNLIHTSYNLHGTVTGRLSSNDPNMQQMPRKVNDPLLFQYSHEIKKLFTSRFGDDGVIMQYDYSQLELRILAVFSQDANLISLYRSGADLHKAVASSAFGVSIEEVTKDQRTASKKIQFGRPTVMPN